MGFGKFKISHVTMIDRTDDNPVALLARREQTLAAVLAGLHRVLDNEEFQAKAARVRLLAKNRNETFIQSAANVPAGDLDSLADEMETLFGSLSPAVEKIKRFQMISVEQRVAEGVLERWFASANPPSNADFATISKAVTGWFSLRSARAAAGLPEPGDSMLKSVFTPEEHRQYESYVDFEIKRELQDRAVAARAYGGNLEETEREGFRARIDQAEQEQPPSWALARIEGELSAVMTLAHAASDNPELLDTFLDRHNVAQRIFASTTKGVNGGRARAVIRTLGVNASEQAEEAVDTVLDEVAARERAMPKSAEESQENDGLRL